MLTPGSQCNGSFFFTSFWLSVGAGKLQYRGVFSVTVGQHSPNISFSLPLPNSGISQSVFTEEKCEVFVLKTNEGERGGVKGKSCVRAAVSSPLLSCYSCSSLCFLALTGPWPFLREPFWGLRSCPRSWSVHGIPPCPSSLSRSESECMRAEEVGAGTGFRRAERERGEQKRKKQCDGAVLNID